MRSWVQTVKRWIVRYNKRRRVVLISDTTLRDGAQMPGIDLSAEQKVTIAAALVHAGITLIDVGFPAASAAETEAIRQVAKRVPGCVLSVLSRTRSVDIERAAEALQDCPGHRRAITLFLGTSPIHREHKSAMSKVDVLETIGQSIVAAERWFQIISFGAEDASRTEPEFLRAVYETAIDAGATSVGFADTVGILTPRKAAEAIKRVNDTVRNIDDAMLAVHFHNDLGLATANSLAAVEAGANIVQGTINGLGERAGNAALEEVCVALALHEKEFGRKTTVDLRQLAALSRLVSEATGQPVPVNKPVVGANMFRTEAGIHQDGLLKHRDTYLPFPPELIGAAPVELVLGPDSGRSAVRHLLRARGTEPTDDDVERMLAALKSGASREPSGAAVSLG